MITLTTLTDIQVLLISIAALAVCMLIGYLIKYLTDHKNIN